MIWIFLIWYLCYRVVYTGYARGSTVVRARCDGCDRKYRYRMARTASHPVRGSSVTGRQRDDADDFAEDLLDRKLDAEFDCVPCPHCGDYQPEMVERLKDRHTAWTKNWITGGFVVAALFLLFGIPLAIAAGVSASSSGRETGLLTGLAVGGCVPGLLALGGAIYLLAARGGWRDRFDPNDPADAEERKAVGEDREYDVDDDDRGRR